jgi:hypothetical protein
MKKSYVTSLLNPLYSDFVESTIAKYGTRYWAVYVNGHLLAVTVYKKGAVAVRDLLRQNQPLRGGATLNVDGAA